MSNKRNSSIKKYRVTIRNGNKKHQKDARNKSKPSGIDRLKTESVRKGSESNLSSSKEFSNIKEEFSYEPSIDPSSSAIKEDISHNFSIDTSGSAIKKDISYESSLNDESGSAIEESFLRENEKSKISSFLNSSEKILHIAGQPGTGKTLTVKYMLKNKKYTYINYILNDKLDCNENIIVLDEFDKFYNSKRSECMNYLKKNSRKKIITISNDLLFNKNCLFFKPYTKKEITEIIRKKIKSDRIEDLLIDIVSAKEYYDLRRVINVFHNLLVQKKDKITLTDLNYDKNNKLSIHQQIVNEIKREFAEKRLAYKNYLDKCKMLRIEGLNRIDFLSIYENIDQ